VRSRKHLAIILLGSIFLMPRLAGAAKLKIGDRAPAFALPDQQGKLVRLEDFRGKRSVVLAFYLRASTPG
jgi:cytochrome oxidase Cu insertion factor (SCO1/SenC/PrrC family)